MISGLTIPLPPPGAGARRHVDNGDLGHGGSKKKGNHIDCPNRHWIAGESSTTSYTIEAVMSS